MPYYLPQKQVNMVDVHNDKAKIRIKGTEPYMVSPLGSS